MVSSFLGVLACAMVAVFGPGLVVIIATAHGRAIGSHHFHFVVLLAAMVFLGAIYLGTATALGLSAYPW